MFEAVGVTVSRLIRTRFGDIVLPRTPRRGRWDELDASLVTALMVQLGLLREDDDSSGGNRRRSKQPQSHDSALPPGFGTMDRNGMNGARIGRRGKLQGGRQGSAGQAAACPSDPFGTGLMIAGGYANGHPLAGGGSVDGNRKGGKPGGRGAASGNKGGARAGGKPAGGKSGGKPRGNRAAASAEQGAQAAYSPAEAVRPPALRAPGGEQPAAPRRPASRRVRAAVVAAPRRPGPVAAATRPKGRAPRAGRGRSGWQERGQGGNKSRSSRGSAPRGDDWQPRGASAHESRLGVLGGGRGRQGR